MTCDLDSLRRRAETLRSAIGERVEIVDSEGSVGGGAFPTARIPSIALAVTGRASAIEARLRENDPPVVGRVTDGRLLLDLRTVFPSEDRDLAAAIRNAAQ